METKLPKLHLQAKNLKNRHRLKFDGGRAWIKNGQLHDAVKFEVKKSDIASEAKN